MDGTISWWINLDMSVYRDIVLKPEFFNPFSMHIFVFIILVFTFTSFLTFLHAIAFYLHLFPPLQCNLHLHEIYYFQLPVFKSDHKCNFKVHVCEFICEALTIWYEMSIKILLKCWFIVIKYVICSKFIFQNESSITTTISSSSGLNDKNLKPLP